MLDRSLCGDQTCWCQCQAGLVCCIRLYVWTSVCHGHISSMSTARGHETLRHLANMDILAPWAQEQFNRPSVTRRVSKSGNKVSILHWRSCAVTAPCLLVHTPNRCQIYAIAFVTLALYTMPCYMCSGHVVTTKWVIEAISWCMMWVQSLDHIVVYVQD